MSCCHAAQPIAPGATQPVRGPLAWWRLVTAVFLAGNSMALSLAVNLSEVTPTERYALHGVLATMSAAIAVLVGTPLLRAVAQAFRARKVGIEALFVCGLLGATGLCCVGVYTGRDPVYFEVIGVLLVIFAWGQQIKGISQSAVRRALQAHLPAGATCLRIPADVQRAPERIAIDAVAVGDHIRVGPGETIPVDGTIVSGQAYMNTAAMTGEGLCTAMGPGDSVRAGMQCLDSTCVLRANTVGTARHIDAMLADIAAGLLVKSRIEQHADRVARVFFPCVVTVASATVLYWGWRQGPTPAIMHGMAVLLVACPCALGFATPTAMWAAVIRLARLGLYTRSTAAVEQLAAVDTLLFDKTGTLTTVDLQVNAWAFITGQRIPEPNILVALAVAAQEVSSHPVARAFAHPQHALAPGYRAMATTLIPGAGLHTDVAGPDGRQRVTLGDPERLVSAEDKPRWQTLQAQLADHLRPIAILLGGELVAAAGVGDQPLPSFVALRNAADARQVSCQVFSGDAAVRLVPWQAVPVYGDMAPEDKAAAVRDLQDKGHRTCFVGDGINDASAMAQSDVSIAIDTGAALAVAAAEFTIAQSALHALPEAIDVARASLKVIRSNLWIAAAYNTAAMAVAAAGYLHPVFAATVMLCSSLLVTVRAAWRLS